MTENELFLENIQTELKQVVQPFQRQLNQKQKKADFIKQCIRCASRDDFLSLDEMLKSKISQEISIDEEIGHISSVFESLKENANEKVELYRIQLVEDLTRLCAEAEIEIDIDFPKFTVLKGITGEIDFSGRCTRINKMVLKSIDPRRITTRVLQLKRQLYDHPYEPQVFLDSLYQVYADLIVKENMAFGDPIPMQSFYLAYVISLQSKPFFLNMEKGKFRGYSLDQFSVDLWRYYEAGIGGTSKGFDLQLTPGRNQSLWLMDTQGEIRQITAIAFQKPQG